MATQEMVAAEINQSEEQKPENAETADNVENTENVENADNADNAAVTEEEAAVTVTEEEAGASKPGHAADPSLNLDGPTLFKIPDSMEEQKVSKFCNKDVKIRFTRWSFIAFMPCIFLLILTYERNHDGKVHLAFLVGLSIVTLYVFYFSLIGWLFYSGARLSKNRSLFRIWTKAEAVPGWASMSIAVNQQLYHFEAIQSISEFSAIDGGIPSFMLSNLGPFTWAVVCMHFASELHCNSAVFTWDIADYMEIVGVTGLVMIGIFELDPYNPGMKTFHYIGAAAGTGTIGGFVVQSWSLAQATGNNGHYVAPILISIIAFTCFILWQLSNKRTVKEQDRIREQCGGKKPNEEEMKEIRALITRLSIQNVVSEGIFLFCGALSLALWLMFYEEDCCWGCAGAINLECKFP